MELIVRFVLTIIIFIIIIVILSKFRAEKSQPETDDSLEIMKKRLESGEITQEDLKEAKRRRGK
ncbi:MULTISPECIES: SHOCT domain-containing protein [Oceanobacillus]|nr:SHOCT domain-containing protein [Oceanobacillus profundus]MBR3118152.1 SHOCT domain-containing protein [Oceanobacillus sp.]MDO6450674.1 SHOCT domain-containing protein [Oceanobacillus profundus]